MAQKVGYSQDNVIFSEGPFVIVEISGFRIEAELKGHKYPVLPDASIYKIMERHGFYGKTSHESRAAHMCDLLNDMVKRGEIVLDCGWWIACPSV